MKEIIIENFKILVDDELYDDLILHKWYLGVKNYARTNIDNYPTTMHSYILGDKKGYVIDHINRNIHDNQKHNLRHATISENARNRTKKKNCLSKYVGISKNYEKWTGTYTHPVTKQRIIFRYDIEEHAAYHRDLLIKKYGTNEVLSNVELPDNFVIYHIVYPKEIFLEDGFYYINKDKIKKYSDIDSAHLEILITRRLKKLEEKINNIDKTQPIIRNKDKIAILITNKGEEILVDDDKYHFLKTISSWFINNDGYPSGTLDSKCHCLHKFLMQDIEQLENTVVDHINRNKLDARMNNLRYASYSLSSHNTTKQEDTKFPYKGIRKHGNKFRYNISCNGTKYENIYNTMLEAANGYISKSNELHNINTSLITEKEHNVILKVFYEKYPDKLNPTKEFYEPDSGFTIENPYKGVQKRGNNYITRITINGKRYSKMFDNSVDAGNEYIKRYNEINGTKHKLIQDDNKEEDEEEEYNEEYNEEDE